MALASENPTNPSPPASANVAQQLRLIKGIINRLINTYHENLMVGQTLSTEFDRVTLAAAAEFTPWQTVVIRDNITIKARHTYPRTGTTNDITAKEMTALLRHCFADSCGHVLGFSYKIDPTEDDAIKGLNRAAWIVQALDDLSSNFTMILGNHLKEFPALETTLGDFRAAIRPLNEAMNIMADDLSIDPALQASMAREVIKEKLHDTTSISHLRAISPDSWNPKPL